MSEAFLVDVSIVLHNISPMRCVLNLYHVTDHKCIPHFIATFSIFLQVSAPEQAYLVIPDCKPRTPSQVTRLIIGLRREKTCIRDFRQRDIQTSLLSHND